MVVDNEFQSQPCPTIHCTNDWTLDEGQADVNIWNQSKLTPSWCEKVMQANQLFSPPHVSKVSGGDHFIDRIPISTFSNQSLY